MWLQVLPWAQVRAILHQAYRGPDMDLKQPRTRHGSQAAEDPPGTRAQTGAPGTRKSLVTPELSAGSEIPVGTLACFWPQMQLPGQSPRALYRVTTCFYYSPAQPPACAPALTPANRCVEPGSGAALGPLHGSHRKTVSESHVVRIFDQ